MTADEFEATYAWRREREVEMSDLDVFRHVNNVRYAAWAESIRAAYVSDVLRRDMFAPGPGVILVRHDLTYETPLAWRERLVLGGRLLRFGTKSFDFEVIVWSQAQQRRAETYGGDPAGPNGAPPPRRSRRSRRADRPQVRRQRDGRRRRSRSDARRGGRVRRPR